MNRLVCHHSRTMSTKHVSCFGYRQAVFATNNEVIGRPYNLMLSRYGNFVHLTSPKQNQFPHKRIFTTTELYRRTVTLATQPDEASSSSAVSSKSNQQANPSWFDEFKFLMLLIHRLLMGMGIVHCFKNYVMDITLCSGPSMLPTIQESNEIILIDRFAMLRGSIQDGTTISSRTHAALLRCEKEQLASSEVSSANMWNALRMGVGVNVGSQQQSAKQGSTVFAAWRNIAEHIMSPISVGDVVIAQNPNRPGTICKRILGLPGDHIIVLNGGHGKGIQIVPDHHVWLEGDNSNNSLDSRQSGPISLSMLRGRAVARIWPLRGDAYLKRTISPPTTTVHTDAGSSQCSSNSIVIPAGYSRQLLFGPMQNDQQHTLSTTDKN